MKKSHLEQRRSLGLNRGYSRGLLLFPGAVGWSIWKRNSDGMAWDITVYVARDMPRSLVAQQLKKARATLSDCISGVIQPYRPEFRPEMKLYRVTRTDRHRCYETFSGFVACAPDEETARMMDPGCKDGTLCKVEESTGRLIINDDEGVYAYETGTWAATLSDVKVEYIGEAAPDMTARVILSDWNEG